MTTEFKNGSVVEYRPLSSRELDLAVRLHGRGKVHPDLKGIGWNDMRVAYTLDGEKKVTCCSLMTFRDRRFYQHIGSAKRITYQPLRDPHNPEIGRDVALAAALAAPAIPISLMAFRSSE